MTVEKICKDLFVRVKTCAVEWAPILSKIKMIFGFQDVQLMIFPQGRLTVPKRKKELPIATKTRRNQTQLLTGTNSIT